MSSTPTYTVTPPSTDWDRELLDLTSLSTAVATGLSLRRKPTVVQMLDLLIWGNGIDNPKVYDPSSGSAYDLGVTAPAAAPTFADQGSGTFAGTYTYAYRYKRTNTGEWSALSPLGTHTASGSAQYIRVTVAASAESGVDKVQLFRSKNGVAAPVYKIAEWADSTTYYDDATADSAIDITLLAPVKPAPGGSASMPVWRYAAVWNGRLFVAWTSTYRSRVYWSEPNAPWLIPATNYADINTQDRDTITGLAVIQDSLVVFKSRHAYIMDNLTFETGISGQGTVLVPDILPVDEGTGAASQHAIAYVDNALFFLSGEGRVHQFPGGQERSPTLDATLRRINIHRLEEAEAMYDEAHRRVLFSVSLDNAPYNSHVLVYDMTTGGWAVDTIGKEAIGAFDDADGRSRTVFADVAGNLHQLHVGDGYGARTGTLTGTVTSATGNTLSDSSAAFAAGVPGLPVTVFVSGVPQETNIIVSRPSATQIKTLWRWGTTPTTSYTYAIGGCFPEWKFGYTAFGDGGKWKLLRYIRLEYVPQSSGKLGIYLAVDHASEEYVGEVDLTGSGEDEIWIMQGFKRQQTRIKCFEGAVGVELLAIEWDYAESGRHLNT